MSCVRMTVAPGMGELERCLGEVEAILLAARVDDGATFRAQLVFEEIVTNAFRHGFNGHADAQVWVTICLSRDSVALEFEDRAPAFDPLSHVAPVGDGSMEGEPVGGRGLLLVRKACSTLRYEHRDGCNRLRAELARATGPGD